MKTRMILTLVAAFALFSTALLAAGIDGKWTAEMKGRDGASRTQTFTFKSDGAVLTGVISGQNGDTPISEGKVDGNEVSFVVSREMNGETRKIPYTGTVNGDELKLKMGTGDRVREVVAKRSTT